MSARSLEARAGERRARARLSGRSLGPRTKVQGGRRLDPPISDLETRRAGRPRLAKDGGRLAGARQGRQRSKLIRRHLCRIRPASPDAGKRRKLQASEITFKFGIRAK